MDVKRDNRVLSLVNRAGLKGTLSQMLDQLQRCQKSLNEFLEVINDFHSLLALFTDKKIRCCLIMENSNRSGDNQVVVCEFLYCLFCPITLIISNYINLVSEWMEKSSL